jgi:hypothetical protein
VVRFFFPESFFESPLVVSATKKAKGGCAEMVVAHQFNDAYGSVDLSFAIGFLI